MSCEALRRLSSENAIRVLGNRRLRVPEMTAGRFEELVQLRITLTCMSTGRDTTIYASAQQTRYELKAGGSSTGLSVAGLGSISVPWPTDKNALVKVGEETIADAEFYRRLFVLIENLAE